MVEPTVERIGRYKILGVIGQGGMGIVYRALDPNIAREVAIKMPHGDKDLLEHFQREVKATASFQHKNIVTVYTVDDFEGFPYMVMEFLDGQSLAQVITSGPTLPLVDKLSLIIQVCDGLQYAHELGVIHRDIKPANIYVLKDRSKGVVGKILDFGIARANFDSTLTRTGLVRGSVSYMSPEQVSGRRVDARTDVYSTGVVLYQILTGELPYKSSDPSATFLKILNDPVPSLGEYIKNYPPSLDEIIGRAMAKNVDERYQSAEELGYELSRLQETLKRGMVAEFLEQAKAAASHKEWEVARQHLQEILKIDRHHIEANDLLPLVRQEIQKQQRSAQIQQLRSQAEIALAGFQYEEALECLEQALRLDPANSQLASLRETIKGTARRAKILADALQRGQAALYVGDLKEADAAVKEALQCQSDHTEARALQELITKEVAERSRRQQLQGYVEEARREISKSQFLSAMESLQKAREIDPDDSNIRELLMWASRGHEQEKRRKSIDSITKEVGALLAQEKYDAAAQACDTGLRSFPEEPSLIKLKQLADKQNALATKRRFVEEQCIRARHLSDARSYLEAIDVIQQALQRYPGEESLSALLGMVRTEFEFVEQEKREAQRSRDEPISTRHEEDKRTRGLAEIRQIEQSVQSAKSGTEIGVLVERAGYVSRQFASDSDVQAIHQQILSYATEFQRGRDNALAEMSTLDEAMGGCQDISQLTAITNQIEGIQSKWPGEKQLRDIADRAAERLHLAKEAKNAIQLELSHLEQSVLSAQSLTQISLYVQQSKILAIEWSDDKDVAKGLAQLQENADAIAQRVEAVCAQIKADTSGPLNASSLKESEDQFAKAAALAKGLEHFEDVKELLDKANRRLIERKNEYQRIESGLQFLIKNTATARSSAELELILARQRDLLGKFPQEPYFEPFVATLEDCLRRRKDELAESLANEEAVGSDTIHELSETSEQALYLPPQRASVSATLRKTEEGPVHRSNAKVGRVLFSVSGLVLAVGSGLFLLYPRTISVLSLPQNASIYVDGRLCTGPCVVRLRPGTHALTVMLKGYEDFRESFGVSLANNKPWTITLKSLPAANNDSLPKILPPPPTPGNTARIIIQTVPAVPGAIVSVDNMPVASTDAAGETDVPAAPGSHSVRVNKPAYKPVPPKNVVATQGNTSHLRFQLERDTSFDAKPQSQVTQVPSVVPPTPSPNQTVTVAPVAAPETFIVLQAPTGSEIHIDQQLAGHSTGGPFKSKVQPGSRIIEVFLPGFQPWIQTLSVDAGREVNVVAKLVAVPTPAASPAAVVARSSSVPEDTIRQVRQVLDAYQQSFNLRNIQMLQGAYPNMPKELLARYKQFFKNKNVEMKLEISSTDIVGSQIKVEGRQSLRFQDDSGKMQDIAPAKVTFLFTNPNGHWVIAAIPTS